MPRKSLSDYDVSVLVLSCDKFADAWPMFFELMHQNWPDCPLPVYLGTNDLSYDRFGVQTLNIGPDKGWSDGALKVLSRIKTRYVFLFFADHFILSPPDEDHLVECLDAMEGLNAGYVALTATQRYGERLPGYDRVRAVKPGAPYRAALNVGLWRVSTLVDMIRPDESAWEFEFRGSRRSDARPEPFLAAKGDPITIDKNGIVQGRWTRSTLRLAKARGVVVTPTQPVNTRRQELERSFKKVKGALVRSIPWEWRFKAGDMLRRVGVLRRPKENSVTF